MSFFHAYVCSYLFADKEWKTIRRTKVVSYICAIGVVFVITSQFTNFYYYFDADNLYHRNTGYIISLLIPVIAMFIDLSLLLQFRKNIRNKIFASMLSYILLPLVAASIQTVWYGVSLINLSIGLAMICMYIASMNEQNWEMYQLLKKKTEVEERLSIAETLNKCVKALSFNVDIDAAIDHLMCVINEYFKGDRSYIFEIIEDGKTLQNTYEYVSDGVEPQKKNLQAVPIDVISVWMECFVKDEVYFMSNIEQESGGESYDMLQEQQVDRLLAVPLKQGKEIIGFLGVDNPRTIMMIRHYYLPFSILLSIVWKEKRNNSS